MDEETITLEDGKVVAEHENSWDTSEIVRVFGDWFYRRINGGRQGSRNAQRGDGSWDSSPLECREIGVTTAREMMLGFGMDPTDVARLTA